MKKIKRFFQKFMAFYMISIAAMEIEDEKTRLDVINFIKSKYQIN